MAKNYVVRITITKTYSMVIEAASPEEAQEKAWDLQTTEIQEKGSLDDAGIEYVGDATLDYGEE